MSEQPTEHELTESLLGEMERVMSSLRNRSHVIDSIMMHVDQRGNYRLTIALLAVSEDGHEAEGSE